jgi:nucleotide-binding universal stress UspA family protein
VDPITTRTEQEKAMNTNPFERILVPTDMSEFAHLALQYALLFQKRLASQLTLLYASEFTVPLNAEYPLGYYLENVPEVRRNAGELLRKYARKNATEEAHVATMVVDDSPARAIVRTADAINADLILMGTHGRHGIQRAVLGSVTERVLRDTNRPVMTVTPSLFPVSDRVAIRSILCPVNFTDVARASLEVACALAAAFDAELVVMHVSEFGAPSVESIEATFRGWVDPLVRRKTRYQQVMLADGEAATRVLEVADQLPTDLIVIGAQHKRFSDATVIGTTTERITRFARHPVLTVIRRMAAVQTSEAVGEHAAALA